MTRFTISIAVHNQLDTTKKCLASVAVHSADCEILIYDNHSSDGTFQYLTQLGGDLPIRIMRGAENVGFGRAHNHLLQIAAGEYFVVLNNDVTVCASWLETMLAEFRKSVRLGACGIKGTCSALDQHGHGKPSTEVEYVEASCLMIPTALARDVGLFDETFRIVYCEDSDLGLRLRERGYELTLVDLPIVHERAVTAKAVSEEQDLAGVHAYNQQILRTRWKDYLAVRNFDRKVVVQRLGAMGDVLAITPVLRAIKTKWAHAEITVVTHQREVLRLNPDVDRTLLEMGPLREGTTFYNLDLSYESRPMVHFVKAYADACEVEVKDTTPLIYPTKEDFQFARETLRDHRWAILHSGPTAWIGRNWPATKFNELSHELQNKGFKVLLVGGYATDAIACDLDLRRQTSIMQLASLMARADLFVGIDSFPMHVAQAFHCPLVGIFGCTDPRLRLGDRSYFRGVTADGVGCLGCHHILPAPRTTSSCLRERVYCMERLTVEKVFKESEIALKEFKRAFRNKQNSRASASVL